MGVHTRRMLKDYLLSMVQDYPDNDLFTLEKYQEELSSKKDGSFFQLLYLIDPDKTKKMGVEENLGDMLDEAVSEKYDFLEVTTSDDKIDDVIKEFVWDYFDSDETFDIYEFLDKL